MSLLANRRGNRNSSIGIVVDGQKDVERMLTELAPRESRNIMRRVVASIARQVRDDVRAKARSVVKRRTGNLFKAIRTKRERGRRDVFEASLMINLKQGRGARAPHWHFIEFGTVKQKARPFITPTVKAWEQKLPRVYRKEFGIQLEKQLAKRAKK